MEDIKRIHEDTVMFHIMLRAPWAYMAVAFLAAAAGSIILTYASTPAYVNTFRAQGVPTSIGELKAMRPEIPASENGALALVAAVQPAEDMLEESLDKGLNSAMGKTLMPAPDKAIPTEMQQEILRMAAANEQCLEQLYAALARPVFRIPKANEMPSGMTETAYAAALRRAMRLLCLDMLRCQIEDNPEGMLRAILAGLALVNTLHDEPLLFPHLVRADLLDFVHGMFSQALNRAAFPDDTLIALLEGLHDPRLNTIQSAAGGYIGELVLGLTFLTRPWEMDHASLDAEMNTFTTTPIPAAPPRLNTAMVLGRFSGIGLYSRIAYVRIMKSLIDMGKLPPHEVIQPKGLLIDIEKAAFIRMPLAALLLPAYNRTFDSSVRALAQIVTARAAVAIERYRLAHDGRTPEALDALVPAYLEAVPADPFDGAPLRYQPLPDGYIVYSIGPNLQDDGGTDPERKNLYAYGDILIRVVHRGDSAV